MVMRLNARFGVDFMGLGDMLANILAQAPLALASLACAPFLSDEDDVDLENF